MRKTAIIAGLVLCAPIFVGAHAKVHAEVPQVKLGNSVNVTEGQRVLAVVNAELTEPAKTAADAPKQVEHIVATGETLTSIAQLHQTTWERLFNKNTNLTNPNIINVGDKIIIPAPDEQIAERALPQAEPVQPTPQAAQSTKKVASKQAAATKPASRGSSSGNTYGYGYCTWYAKNRRPDLPNNLGNASTWVARAQSQGIPTGSAPRAGAIGQRGNHVVYVESVNGDGSVTVSEMNHKGWNVVSSRTVSGDYFSYIY